jgi:hypothetical protein
MALCKFQGREWDTLRCTGTSLHAQCSTVFLGSRTPTPPAMLFSWPQSRNSATYISHSTHLCWMCLRTCRTSGKLFFSQGDLSDGEKLHLWAVILVMLEHGCRISEVIRPVGVYVGNVVLLRL